MGVLSLKQHAAPISRDHFNIAGTAAAAATAHKISFYSLKLGKHQNNKQKTRELFECKSVEYIELII